mmetsp:Transcript_13375/g.19697  ORF Transcript_13375/g.19697 Transcript_13375/m.19697 type:complete len:86 (-) Transcript_13375:74-331(-)
MRLFAWLDIFNHKSRYSYITLDIKFVREEKPSKPSHFADSGRKRTQIHQTKIPYKLYEIANKGQNDKRIKLFFGSDMLSFSPSLA